MKTHLSFLISHLFLFAFGISLAAKTYEIDPAHSYVGFKIRHFAGKTAGHFGKFSGSVDLDQKHPSKTRVKAEIDAASIDTGNEKRDKHLRDEDFFFVEKFPTLSFDSTAVEDQGGTQEARMTGTLTMRGVSIPVELKVEKLGSQMDDKGKEHVGFEASGRLDRKDYGIAWNKELKSGGLMLGDDVDLQIQIEAVAK